MDTVTRERPYRWVAVGLIRREAGNPHMARNCPDLITMMKQLIETASISSVQPALDMSNLPVIELLAGWLEDLGFAVEVPAVPNEPGKANLIARIGAGTGGLVLAGHTDTVPCDEHLWSHDPFQLTETDGRLYGLGTADMKAFLALALEAARHENAKTLTAPLTILATADEESSMTGAKALVAQGKSLGQHAIIGEPTGLKPVRMHKGIMMDAIAIHGRSGHSSDPSLGANAMEAAHAVIGDLMKWRGEIRARESNAAFAVPYATLNLGHIHGGDNPNRICGDCEIHIDLRPLPGMDTEELREELRARVRRVLENTPFELEFRVLFDGIPALETAADAAIVSAAETLTGQDSSAVAFGTEGPYFKKLGTDTIILGPGDIEQAHQPDEYLALDTIQPTLQILEGMIHRFCHSDKSRR